MALVLKRRVGQKVVIDPSITVTITSIDRGSVRLSIDAPRHISIMRDELLERIGKPASVKATRRDQ